MTDEEIKNEQFVGQTIDTENFDGLIKGNDRDIEPQSDPVTPPADNQSREGRVEKKDTTVTPKSGPTAEELEAARKEAEQKAEIKKSKAEV